MTDQQVTLPPALEVDVLRGHITREYAVELVRLRSEIEKAYREGWMHRDKFNYQPCDIAFNAHSRAKRVMEGRE